MPRGEKSAYTDMQKRQAEHIEESEIDQGRSREDAERLRLGHGEQAGWRRQEIRIGPQDREEEQQLMDCADRCKRVHNR